MLSIPLFAGLSKKERQTIAQHADVLDFEEGRHLVREGEFPYEFFVLEEGTAEVTHRRRAPGRPRPRRLLRGAWP